MQTVLSPPTTLWCADGLAASIDGPGLQNSYRVDKPYLLIGSSPHADIALPLVDFASVALYLHVTNDSIAWLDLSSPTGQWRTGAFAKSGCLVWRGYHIALERLVGGHRDAETFNQLETAPAPDDRPSDVPVFNIEFEGEQLARAKLASTMTLVGQSDRCRLRLRNRHVSYDHCLFYVAERHAWVIDLLSDEGTFVRGQRVSAVPIFSGDVVTVGKPTMTLRRWSESKSAIQRPSQRSGLAVAFESDLQSSHHAPHDVASTQVADDCITVGDVQTSVPSPIDANCDLEASVSEPASITLSVVSAETVPVDTTAAYHSADGQTADSTTEPRPRSVADTIVDTAALRDTVFDHAERPTCEIESPTSEVRPLTHNSKVALVNLQSPAVNPHAQLPDPSLDRLIDRHKINHRRTIVRWSVASSMILAAFLSVVVWGSRNIDFYNTEPTFPTEPRSSHDSIPPAAPSAKPAGPSTDTFSDDTPPTRRLNDSPTAPAFDSQSSRLPSPAIR
jgi:hypothetical protein